MCRTHPGGARSLFPRLASSRPVFLTEFLNSATDNRRSKRARSPGDDCSGCAEQPKSVIPAKGGLVPLVCSKALRASAPLAWRTTNTTIAARRPAPTFKGCVSVPCEWLQTEPAYADEKQDRADEVQQLLERWG